MTDENSCVFRDQKANMTLVTVAIKSYNGSLCSFHQVIVPAPVNQHQHLLPVQLQVDMIVPVMRLMTVLRHTFAEVSQPVSANNKKSCRVVLKLSKL